MPVPALSSRQTGLAGLCDVTALPYRTGQSISCHTGRDGGEGGQAVTGRDMLQSVKDLEGGRRLLILAH